MLQFDVAPTETGNRSGTTNVAIVMRDSVERAQMARWLRSAGYDGIGVADDNALDRLFQERAVALVLLEATQTDDAGLALCQSIRGRSNVPIVILSTCGEERDCVAGLDAGADDYVAKPYRRSELQARIRALLRRARDPHVPLDIPASERFDFAGWSYQARRRQLYAPPGNLVELTSAEHDLLLTLLRNPQRMIGRERLLEMSRSRVGDSSDRSIDVLVSRLRRKLGDGRRAQPLIRTIRGVGYMFAPDVVAS